MRLTCNDDLGAPAGDLSVRGPGDAFAAVAVQSKVFLDVVAADVSLDLQLADARHRVDKLVLRVVLAAADRLAVARKVELQGVGGAAGQRRRFALDDERVLGLLEQHGQRAVRTPRGQRIQQQTARTSSSSSSSCRSGTCIIIQSISNGIDQFKTKIHKDKYHAALYE